MTVNACENCKTETAAGARNCPACGAPMLANFMPDPRRAAARARNSGDHTWRNVAISAVIVLGCLTLLGRCSSLLSEIDRRADVRQEADALAKTGRELLLAEKARLDDIEAGRTRVGSQPQPAANSDTALPAPATNTAELLRGMNRIVSDMGQRSAHTRAQLQAEVATLKLDAVLAPQNLVDARGIASGQSTMRRYLTLVEASNAIARADTAELDRRVYALAGGVARNAQFIAGYEQSKRQRVTLDNEQIANQRRAVAATQALLAFAHARLGRISLDGKELLFRSQSDLDTYRRLLADFDREAAQEEEISRRQRKMIDDALASTDKLKAM
ncbi:hypothetical protein ASE35_13875 [Lysobacter sp. Root916]|uniref:zinc ribbon domain-containing protein n=1 Tax=Lysobacter sp. Root916 TaxID=1736606 RepID=UPI00070FB0A8|nr:zinc ribbon domain-containing protein [Lysobacter sp. Root916]KRD32039.1 hypothetical protein ASE35_13875 [Lysobacter sp. Root916]